jgi:hypothetical protein
VLHQDGGLSLGVDGTAGAYLGGTARRLRARLSQPWPAAAALGVRAMPRPLELRMLRRGHWAAAWLLCKFRGARRLSRLRLPDGGDVFELPDDSWCSEMSHLLEAWVVGEWQASSVSVENLRIKGTS